MRATLFRNPTAGSAEYHDEVLVRMIEDRGYEVTFYSTRKEGWSAGITDPGDLVVVAGGDGTVAKVVKGLTGKGTPLAILPVGTANNVARSLGVVGRPEDLIREWDPRRTRPLAIGVAEGPWGKRRFVESVGLGLFAQAIALANSTIGPEEQDDRETELATARSILKASLAATRAQPCELTVNGLAEPVRGSFLLIEAMITSHLGPGIRLAARAEAGDGSLELVLVEEASRSALTEFLAEDHADGSPEPPFCARRVERLQFAWDGQPLHVDDEVFAGGMEPLSTATVSVRVGSEPPVSVLVPP